MVSKDIAVLFGPRKALFIEILNRNTIASYATQRPYGLSYTSNSQDAVSVKTLDGDDTVRGMKATVDSALDIDTDLVSSNDGLSGESNHLRGVSPQMCTDDTIDRIELASNESTGSEDTTSFVFQLRSSDGDTDSDWDDATHGLNGRGRAQKS